MKAAEFLKNWDESKHIRDDGGRFGSGVGTLTRDVGAEFLSSRAQDKSSAAERARSGGSHVDDQIESHLGAAIAHVRAAEAHRDAANNEEAKMHQDKATEHVTEANLLRIDKVTAKSVRPDEPESEKIQKAKEWLEVVKTDISRVDTVFVKDWDESKHPRGAGGRFGSGEAGNATGANYEHHVSEAMGASKEAQDALASLHKATDKGNTIIRQRVSALDSAHRTAASHFDKIGEKQLAYEHMRVGEMAARLRTNLSSANRQRALDGVLNASSSALDATNRWADS
jgi:hypothetical protein